MATTRAAAAADSMDFLMIVAHICSHAPPLHWMTELRKRRKRRRGLRVESTESLKNR